MRLTFAIVAALVPGVCFGQSVASSYATRDGRIGAVVISCPSQDGAFTAGPCTLTKPGPVLFAGPAAASIIVANVAVTVFTAGSIQSGCDVVNTGTAVLYLDFIAVASAGSATALPLLPGQAYHCAFAPIGAVSAVAAQPQAFVAIRY